MSKLSYKTLFIIVFFLLIAIVVLLRFFIIKPNPAAAGWWNESWSYRKSISITNSSGSNLNNAQIKLLDNIDLSTLVSTGKLLSNLNDLRFTDINGNLISYWIEDSTNSSVDVWGFVPSLPSSNTSIYMYYGNSSASSSEIVIGTQSYPGISCKAIINSGITNDGVYYLDPNGLNPSDNYQAYCDMTYDGGGWTMMMKATRGTTFNYDANYWTTANTLNETDVTRNDADAKYQAFNELKVNDIMARWPDFSDIRWLKTGAWSTAVTPLTGFNTLVNWGNPQNQPDWNATYFSSQAIQCPTGPGVYGTKLVDLGGVASGSRWGYRFNENGCGEWGSDDAGGGIGIKAGGYIGPLATTGASAGDSYGCCGATGANRTARVEVYGRESVVSVENVTSASPTSEELSPAPIAYWKFNEGVGTTAYDSNSYNNGSIGSTTWQDENNCISGKCLSYDGSNRITVNNNSNIDLSKNLTISFWIKSTDTTSQRRNPIDKAYYGEFSFTQEPSRGISYYHGQNTTNYFGTGLIPADTIQDSIWYYITMVRDIGQSKVYGYVNGKQVSDTTYAVSPSQNTDNIYIAGGYTGQYYKGYTDDVKIYPYARTAAQIKLDYNSRGSSKGSSVNLGVKSNTAPSLSSKLLGYYKFEDGSGIVTKTSNYQTNILNGTLKNGPNWITNGKTGRGLIFDGLNDYVEIPNHASIKYTGGDMSFSVWFKPDSSDDGGLIISKPWNGGGQYNYGISTSGGSNPSLTFSLAGASSYSLGFNQTIPSDKWSHIVATVNSSSQVKLYINGKLTNSGNHSIVSWTPGSGDNNLPFAIGTLYPYGEGWGGVTSHAAKGSIDEVKIYNSALTAEEIKQDYNQGSATQFGATNQTIGGTTTSLEYCIPGDTSFCSPPVAEWNFEENTGSNAYDTGTTKNNGSLGAGIGASAPLWTVGKKNTGSGLKFDGVDDRVMLTSTINLVDTNDWTVSAWVKTSAANSSILSNSSGGPVVNDIRIANSKISYAHYSSTWLYEYGNLTITDNKWHFLTWVNHSNKTMDMYVDGIGDTLGVGSSQSIGPVNQIGRNWGSTANATIDQVRIYNYARTPAQIAYDHNKGAPIAHWKLDECQGLTAFDSSGSGYTGAISIGPSGTQNSAGTCQIGTSAAWTAGASGKINGSLNFDGTDDYLTTVNMPATGSFSLSTWFKPGSNITDGQRIYWGNGTNRAILAYSGTNGNLQWYVQTTGGAVGYTTSANRFQLNDWNHTVLIYDGSLVKLYINGILDPNTGSLTGASSTSGFNFGTNYDRTANWFNGQIDDIKFYNYPLTSEQVKTVYNNGAVNFR